VTATVPPAVALAQAIDRTGSIACVGLDPRPSLLPPGLVDAMLDAHGPGRAAVGAAFVEFNRRIIEAVTGHCPAVKPQVACYEAYGASGWLALEATVTMAREAGLVVIADAKRNDIGSTAAHYGQAFLGHPPGLDGAPLAGLGADWLTVNGYLGADTVEPLLDAGDGGVFVLVRTSNPSAVELQDAPSGSGTVSDAMARLVAGWGPDRVGAVVGATYPDQARRLRDLMPDTWFLVPGYGAQGAGAADALAGARPDGGGVLVNSSRGIIGAWQERGDDDWGAAAAAALDAMNADLGRAAS
jgi:orotidine-5'-phosphate decarboxylase